VHEVTDDCAVFPIGLLVREKLVYVNRWRCKIFGNIDLALFSICELTKYTRTANHIQICINLFFQ
jgi:hypothetical protein